MIKTYRYGKIPVSEILKRDSSAPDVYEAVKELEIGQTVYIEGFLYWYEGPQPHITKIEVK